MNRFVAYLASALAILGSVPAAAAVDYDPLDVRHWGNILAAPDAQLFNLDETQVYRTGSDRLAFALYKPAIADNPPVVVIVNGIGDNNGDRPMDWGIYRGWGALFAANGIATVTMSASPANTERNLADLIDHLEQNGRSLGIDARRIAIFSASANTTVAGNYLVSAKGRAAVDAAVFYYGNAPAGDLPTDIPVMFVVAEGDLRAPVGGSYAGLFDRVMQAKVPWTLVFGSSQPHAFDALDPTPESRRIVAQTIDFVRRSLIPVAGDPNEANQAERALLRTFYNNQPEAAIAGLKSYLVRNPESTRARLELGRRLADAGRMAEAGPVLQTALEKSPGNGPATIAWSRVLLSQGKAEEAYRAAKMAVDGGFNSVQAIGQLGTAALAAGHIDEGIAAFRAATEMPFARGASFYNLACALALSGDTNGAFAALDQAVANGYRNADGMMADKDLDSLRGDPRLAAIETRMRAATGT